MRYHVLKDRFEYFGALPEPRNYHAAVYYQGNIYVSGKFVICFIFIMSYSYNLNICVWFTI